MWVALAIVATRLAIRTAQHEQPASSVTIFEPVGAWKSPLRSIRWSGPRQAVSSRVVIMDRHGKRRLDRSVNHATDLAAWSLDIPDPPSFRHGRHQIRILCADGEGRLLAESTAWFEVDSAN